MARINIPGVSINSPVSPTGAVFTSIVFDDRPISDAVNTEIPLNSVLMIETGEHVGPDGSANLVVAGTPWIPSEWISWRVRNVMDVIEGNGTTTAAIVARAGVVSNISNTIVAPLSGGLRNTWDIGDKYEIVCNPTAGTTLIFYENTSNLGGAVTLDSKGVPRIVGSSGTHTFRWYLSNPGVEDSEIVTSGVSVV